MSDKWTALDSDKTYQISKWGQGYFGVNGRGHLTVIPEQEGECVGKEIDIKDVIDECHSIGISLPAVIRFHDILRSRVRLINETFRDVINEADYQGRYFGVYPIKVNQMREVVEEIVDAGERYDFGLEAGSKAELMATLAYNRNKNSLTILNGYKDDEYLKLALMGKKLGQKYIIVIEKFNEIQRILKLAKELKVRPLIGLRARLSVEGQGRWAQSTGIKAKFGLTTAEILNAVNYLSEEGYGDCIKLFHFHIGSQISDIKTLKDAISEGGRLYAKLVKSGINIEYFDAGGGLGVDYDGTKSTSDSSKNYRIQEYVSDIVWGLKQICDLEQVHHPNIVTESGRAITAHHSCVITNVIDEIQTTKVEFCTKKVTGEHIIVGNMRKLEEIINNDNFQEIYNEATQLKDEGLQAFKLGILSLEEKAKIETIYWRVLTTIKKILENKDFVPEELQSLGRKLSSQYLCNFSVFQSAADTWAIRQMLPVAPITRLLEKPDNYCTLADITCDSDGKVDRFISSSGAKKTIPLHNLKKDEDYLIGLFLTGAYQDVMGDMHNLFGRLNEVHVYADPGDPKGFYIEEAIRGNTASAVLSTMQYNPDYLAHRMKKLLDKEVSRGNIPPREGVRLTDFYEDCLKGYTYLNMQ